MVQGEIPSHPSRTHHDIIIFWPFPPSHLHPFRNIILRVDAEFTRLLHNYPKMHPSKSTFLLLVGAVTTNTHVTHAFVPSCRPKARVSSTPLRGYLDNLSRDLNAADSNPIPDEESREANKMDKSQIVSYGPGSFKDFVDFGEEFDGGDGQMGVAGDGNKGLEKMDDGKSLFNSKSMSAKNAWGTSSGYADALREGNPKMDTARAQQLENWANQQEVRAKNQSLKNMADAFDSKQNSAEEDWRQLAKFGVERNEEFDMDAAFGPVTAGDKIEGVIELKSAVTKVATHDLFVSRNMIAFFVQLAVRIISSIYVFSLRLIWHNIPKLRNPFMGFSDFRAAFTSNTPMDWSIEPNEGSLKQREDTHFIVKFKPQGPGLIQGYLVIETEDFKKTWLVQGST